VLEQPHNQAKNRGSEPPRPGKPRKPQRLPRSLHVDEVAALLAQPNTRYPSGTRNRAILATMVYGGLRCAEVLALRPRDIDFKESRLRVLGKGKKERSVPIRKLLALELLAWRARRPSSERFFCTRDGKAIGDRYVRKMVKRYGLRAGINDLHPHLLRHTCATHWVGGKGNKKVELHEAQLLLGHASLRTTQRYLHAAIPDLVEKFLAFDD
jgi:integrase/recombinase XerC